ncbi:MAG: GIY-YIG nuclease family protein [Alphaproteobacteria bacterium]|nr:GIY-YIG nuclease family protein [Alphaproteobacteria bacterium]
MVKKTGKIWFVYVLECRNKRLYTGITTDLEARLQKHKTGKGAMFTRLNPPSHFIGAAVCADRSAASRQEAAIKKLSAAEKRALAATWPARVQAAPGSTTV